MIYHIDTGLIYEVFKKDTECPICEIKKKVEEQFLHEFLNDAVMEDNTRIAVKNLGFCADHFDKLFARQNKLSLSLQVRTRSEMIKEIIKPITSIKQAKAQAKQIDKSFSTCIICDYVNESMKKYYKTIAKMFVNEKEFRELFILSKGFCLHHYQNLLNYALSAGLKPKEYLSLLSKIQCDNFARVDEELKKYVDSHDYRNAYKPLGSAETALPRTREKYYGKY